MTHFMRTTIDVRDSEDTTEATTKMDKCNQQNKYFTEQLRKYIFDNIT